MTIELRTYASGDTDYISKMNANVSDIQAAINALQAQVGAAGPGTAQAAGLFMDALFNGADCLVGPGSYLVTQYSTTLTVDPGTMYLGTSKEIVQLFDQVTINLVGQTAGQKYIVVDAAGYPALSTSMTFGTIYSVYWTGGGFLGEPVRIAQVFYDAAEATASRESTAIGDMESPGGPIAYPTLDDRLEAVEEIAAKAATDGADALDLIYETIGTSAKVRKVGCTVSDTGVAGAIQLDFAGEIIGWSVIADVAGDLTVEVSRLVSSPPPSAPNIPDEVTDKISASAPVQLSAAQSAASAEAGVSTWSTTCNQWDVIQFNVVTLNTITRATLYLRILETPASPE